MNDHRPSQTIPNMSQATTPSAQQRFLSLLKRDILKLDMAELNFGIYRILNYRRAQILDYLDESLPSRIAAWTQALAQASGREMADTEAANCYYHLHIFFSRYWDDGDFIPRARRGGSAAYAVPYNGQDTHFHWATKGSHYVKSGELFARYAYKDNDREVRFSLERADIEKDNTKGAQKYFFPTAVQAVDGGFEVSWQWRSALEAESKRYKTKSASRPAGGDADEELSLEEAGPATEGANLQERVLNAWLAGDDFKSAKLPKEISRELLASNVRRFVRKNTSDFFVHPQLGEFLRGELDVYLKHEFVQVWDAQDDELPRIRAKFKLVRDIARDLIVFLDQIERFQATLFEKRKFVLQADYLVQSSWLQREGGEAGKQLVAQACANAGQAKEWAHWVGDKAKKPDGKKLLAAYPHLPLHTWHFDADFKARALACFEDLEAALGGELIHADNYAALRTIEPAYRERVKCIYIDPPYNTGTDGFPYKDTFRHSSWLSMITGRLGAARPLLSPSGALYSSIDENERSALAAAMAEAFGPENRVEELIWEQNTTHSQSPTYSTNHEYVMVWAKDRKACEAEPAMFREPKPGYLEMVELMAALNPQYPATDDVEARIQQLFDDHLEAFKGWLAIHGKDYNKKTERLDPWRGLYNYSHAEYRDPSGALVAAEHAKERKAELCIWRESDPSAPASKQSDTTRDPKHPNYRFYQPVHPITKKKCPFPKRGYGMPYEWIDDGRESFIQMVAGDRIVFGKDETKIPQFKRFLQDVESNVAQSVFSDYTDGEKELTSLIGKSNSFDGTPKPTTLPAMCARQANSAGRVVADFFSGSGTTGQAIISLNREDGGARKFVLVEQSDYFESLVLPRIAKVMAAPEWKDGAPKDSVNHDDGDDPEHWSRRTLPLVRVLRLERYEDSLNALDFEQNEPAVQSGRVQVDIDLVAHDEQNHLLRYWLMDDSAGQPVRLSTQKLTAPFAYQLTLHEPTGARLAAVDLQETARLLLGLAPKRHRDPSDPQGQRHQLMEAVLAAELARGSPNPKPVLLWLRAVDDERDEKAAQAEYAWLAQAVQAEFKRELKDYATIFHNRAAFWPAGLRGTSIDSLLAERMMERAR